MVESRAGATALVAIVAAVTPLAGLSQEPGAQPAWIGVQLEQRYQCLWETQENWKTCDLVLRVSEMVEAGPAATGGIQLGDQLVAINGEIIDSENWGRLMASIRAGTPVSVDVVRDSTRYYVHIVPERRPRDAERIRMIRLPADFASPSRRTQAFVFTLTQPDGQGASFALTVREDADRNVLVEPVVVRILDGQLRLTPLDDAVFVELPELRRELLGNLEAVTESTYESAASALQVVDRVRARLSYPDFQRRLFRIAQVGLEEASLAVRLRRSFGGAEFQPVRRFSGRRPGLLVVGVVPRTAAARLGLRSGDVVYRAGDARTVEVEDLIAATRADESIRIFWVRDTREMNSVWRAR